MKSKKTQLVACGTHHDVDCELTLISRLSHSRSSACVRGERLSREKRGQSFLPFIQLHEKFLQFDWLKAVVLISLI